MIRRRACVCVAAALGLSRPVPTLAQPKAKVPRVALVFTTTPTAQIIGADPVNPYARAFTRRLGDLGYVDGRTILLERRSSEGRLERLPALMREMIALKVDAIVAVGTAAQAAARASSTIPIVSQVDDPVGLRLTDSLARPSRNVTGVTDSTGAGILGKRLQLLKEAAPNSARVASIDFKYVSSRESPGTHLRRREAEAAARALGMTLIPVGVDNAEQFDQAFAAIVRERADSLIEMGNAVNLAGRRTIVGFAAQQRLPAVYTSREFAAPGGLIAYGASIPALFGRLADYVDKILKGARIVDLPFEQPTQYELVINLKTARALGLTVSRSLLLRADEVIE